MACLDFFSPDAAAQMEEDPLGKAGCNSAVAQTHVPKWHLKGTKDETLRNP